MDFKTLYAENCAGCHGAEGAAERLLALAIRCIWPLRMKPRCASIAAECAAPRCQRLRRARRLLTDKQMM